MAKESKLQLTDENIYPDENVLKAVLGRSYNAFLALVNIFKDNDLIYEWRYYRDGKAWLCKVQNKKKTIVWMSVWNGFIKASVYLPGRYLDELLKLNISDETKSRIGDSKKVGKSIACTFEIRNLKALKDIEKVMKFKISAK